MTQTNNIEREFKTPLGIVRCGFSCNQIDNVSTTKNIYENGSSEIFKTPGHQIEIISFKIRVPLYNGETVADSLGWIFRVEKTCNAKEEIETYCLLEQINIEVSFDIATGEHLDAVQAENEQWILHIGTEDGEVLNSRAENDDWFPARLKNTVDFYQSITELSQTGLVTKLPELYEGEKIHIQYLSAYEKNDEQKINSWLAVDESKRNLENWIGIW